MIALIYKYLLLVIKFSFTLFLTANLSLRSSIWGEIGDIVPKNESSFDFIVVGSGSAGSVVAYRLGEKGYSVLLLEAGREEHWLQRIPLLTSMFQDTVFDWRFQTEAQEWSFKAFNGHKATWPRGKGLGGSSMLNFMLYSRGNRKDFDEWARDGNPGWSYKDVVPFFKMNEELMYGSHDDRGTSGPMKVRLAPHVSKFSEIFHQTFLEMGIPHAADPSEKGDDQEFTSYSQLTLDRGLRWGSFKQFDPWPSKVQVMTQALVSKVIIEDSKAKGVSVEHPEGNFIFGAKNEVILSAGSIGSPQLLMVSGIGPKDHLLSQGVEVFQDLPVGENLQDHLLVPFNVYSNDWSHAISFLTPLNPFNYIKLFVSGTGPLTEGGMGTYALIKSNKTSDPRPDLMINSFNTNYNADYGTFLKLLTGLADEAYSAIFAPFESKASGSLMPTLLRPKSRGFIKIQSKDISQPVIIDPKYLSHPEDQQVLVEGLKLSQKAAYSLTFQTNGVRPFPRLPPCSHVNADTDDYWQCYLSHLSHSMFHPVGTCKMGPKDDPSSVVTPDLKVKGVSNLRVVDGSIMPKIVSGPPHATISMIGEKAAAMISEEWPTKSSVSSVKDEL